MIVRVSIANLDVTEASKLGQESGFAGTVYPNVGFGSWGVEHGVTFEFADAVGLRPWIEKLLRERHEQAAYVTLDGRHASLWYADGHDEVLSA
jgi:hypothetical protein